MEKDIEKPYTIDELNDMKMTDFRIIEDKIKKFYENYFNVEQKEVIEKAREITRFPYLYALNKHEFIMGEENEAEIRRNEITLTIKTANGLLEECRNKMPKNMRETYYSMQKMNLLGARP